MAGETGALSSSPSTVFILLPVLLSAIWVSSNVPPAAVIEARFWLTGGGGGAMPVGEGGISRLSFTNSMAGVEELIKEAREVGGGGGGSLDGEDVSSL